MTARAIVALLALLAASPPAAASDAQWLEPGPPIPGVTLVDQDGEQFGLRDLIAARPVLVSFFFTGCTTICPTETARMDLVRTELDRRRAGAASGGKPVPLLLSISLDPLGDSPDAMRAFAGKFGITLGADAGWMMLAGSYDNLQQVWRAFDQPVDASLHDSLMWVGQPANGRWTRVSAFATTEVIADMIEEQP